MGKILIIDNDSKHIVSLEKLVEGVSQGNANTIHHSKISRETVQTYETIVLSGGAHRGAANHDNIYRHYMNNIINHPGKVIGICLGAQLLYMAYGGTIYKREDPLHGYYNITYKGKKHTCYRAQKRDLNQEPEQMKSLNKSKTIRKHITKNHWSLFFHPEKESPLSTSGTIFKEILTSKR